MKITTHQIIIVLVAFLVGVAGTTLIMRDKSETPSEANEIILETPEEDNTVETEVSETTEENTPIPASQTQTAPKPVTESNQPSTQFVSGACQTGLSGRKDEKLNAVVINWSPCDSDDFQLYKLVKSSINTSPNYPADPVAFTSSNKNAANFVDKTVAARTTYYYRLCVIQRLGKVNCSNVASVSF